MLEPHTQPGDSTRLEARSNLAGQRGAQIALTGATGTVGQVLLRDLAARGLRPRALVRAPSAAAAGLADLMQADLERPDQLRAAFDGVQRLFMLTPLHPDQDALQIAILDAAKRAGVAHVVKLSAFGANPRAVSRILRQHGRAERHLIDSGMGYTCLRPNAFMQNVVQWQASIASHDAIMLPVGDARVSMIDVRDIAAVAAEALIAPEMHNGIHELTGPQALSYTEIAGYLSAAAGRTIRYRDVAAGTARQTMLAARMPNWAVQARLELYATYRAGAAERTTPDVAEITGRAPRRFCELAAELGPRLRR